jgi:hypothetical protein
LSSLTNTLAYHTQVKLLPKMFKRFVLGENFFVME